MAEPEIPPPLGDDEIPPPLGPAGSPFTYQAVRDDKGNLRFVPTEETRRRAIDLTGARVGGGRRYQEAVPETVAREALTLAPRSPLAVASPAGEQIAQRAIIGPAMTAAAIPGFVGGEALAGPGGAALAAPLLPALMAGAAEAQRGGPAGQAAGETYLEQLPMTAALGLGVPMAAAVGGPLAETAALAGIPIAPAIIEKRVPLPEEILFSAIPLFAHVPDVRGIPKRVPVGTVSDQFVSGGRVTPDVTARAIEAQANPLPPRQVTPREPIGPPLPIPEPYRAAGEESLMRRRASDAIDSFAHLSPDEVDMFKQRLRATEGLQEKRAILEEAYAQNASAGQIAENQRFDLERFGTEEPGVLVGRSPQPGGPDVSLAAAKARLEPVGTEPIPVAGPEAIVQAGAAETSAFVERDVAPKLRAFADAIKDTGYGLLDLSAPKVGVQRKALDAVYRMLGGRNKAAYVIDSGFKAVRDQFDKLPPAEQVAFVDRYKQGVKQPTPWQESADTAMRAIDKAAWDEAEALGVPPTWKDNHFRVLWKVLPGATKEQGSSAFSSITRRPLRGTQGQFKKSTLDTMSEGIARGGVPVDPNPVRLFQLAQADMMKFITAKRMFDWGKDNGFIKFAKRPSEAPEHFVPINDRIAKVYFKTPQGTVQAGEYYAEPGFGRIINNHLSSDIIRETAVGRGIVKAKMLTTGIELGLSPFHATFETLESVGSQLGLAGRKVWNLGVAKRNPGYAVEGVKDFLSSPFSWITSARTGGSALRYARDPEAFLKLSRGKSFLKQYPQAKAMVDDLFDAGGALAMHDDYRLNTWRAMKQEARAGNPIGAMARLPAGILEMAMYPLFEVYIPRLKVGTFFKEHALRLKEYSEDIASGRTTRGELSRDTWHFTEDRFGEMNFDTLFWNRTFKTSLQLMFRSITWKLGNLRAFGKAVPLQARELYRAGREGRVPRIEPGVGWLMGMSLLTTGLGAVISKTQSGKYPWEWEDGQTTGGLIKNIVFPHYDANDPSKRMATPTYWKDMFHLIHSPGGYVRSSLAGLPTKLWEDWQNRDYFNTQVYNPRDPYHQQAIDMMSHLMPVPFSVTGAMRLAREEAPARVQVMNFMGFTKAPRWVSQTPFEEIVSESISKDIRPAKTQEEAALYQSRRMVIEALREKRQVPADAVRFAKENNLNGRQTRNIISRSHEDPRVTAIKHVTDFEDALDAWEAASPEEKAVIANAMKQKTVAFGHAHGIKHPLFIRAKEMGLLP